MLTLHYILDIHLAKSTEFVALLVGRVSGMGDGLARGSFANELVHDLILEPFIVLDVVVDRLWSG